MLKSRKKNGPTDFCRCWKEASGGVKLPHAFTFPCLSVFISFLPRPCCRFFLLLVHFLSRTFQFLVSPSHMRFFTLFCCSHIRLLVLFGSSYISFPASLSCGEILSVCIFSLFFVLGFPAPRSSPHHRSRCSSLFLII